jgi:hypothetical protein
MELVDCRRGFLNRDKSGVLTMPQTIRGKAHGRTIELDQDPEITDGQEVQVTVRAIPSVAGTKLRGEGIRQSAGPLPDDSPQDDRLLAQIQQARHAASWREVPG